MSYLWASSDDGSRAACRRPLPDEFSRIVEHRLLSAHFQPIVSLHSRTVSGYEGLIRGPSDSPLHSPGALFGEAARAAQTERLDLLCRETLINSFARLRLNGQLFLNICPSLLLVPHHPTHRTHNLLHQAGVRPDRVVIELTETHPIDDYDLLRDSIALYRRMGFKIAIDDLGAGYSGLRGWSELRPDYVKIDRHFISNVHEDDVKRQFIHSICEIAKGLRCKVVAEGIETREEWDVIRSLDIDFAQGHLFSPPKQHPSVHIPEGLFSFEGGSLVRSNRSLQVGSILIERPTLLPTTSLDEVVKTLRGLPDINYIAVVQDKRPCGLVSRLRVLDLYSNLYARDLHGRKHISHFMHKSPRIVEIATPLTQLSREVTDQGHSALGEDFVIVDKHGRYLGMGTVMDLLRRITDLQIRHARYANPLTQLPGNVPINEHLEDLLDRYCDFTLLYIDIDNFKPYNDTYGYARGDDVLRTFAQLMRRHFDSEEDFLGHVGGDDFIIVSQSPDWHCRTTALLGDFERRVPLFYDERDRISGGVTCLSRRGEANFFPFVSVSVGAVPVCHPCSTDPLKLSEVAAAVKRQAKAAAGNSIFVERRGICDSGCEAAEPAY